jgi:hypothetical protein
MTYPFVAAKFYTAGGMKQPRAVVVHMAEGGGTVSWLTHPTNDNSSHFVVEYSGRVVQMVRDADASHSLHVDRPSGPPGAGDYLTYSLDAAKAVLGTGIADPNAYIFALEIEGFAASGPNEAQTASLKALIADLRARHPGLAGNLGHRDFQNYKPCPGGRIPWLVLGGHGLYSAAPTEEDMTIAAIKGEDWKPTVTNGQSNGVYRATPDRAAPIVARLPADSVIRTIAEVYAGNNNWRLTEIDGKPAYFLRTDLAPLVSGGDPAVDAALNDYITRKPAADCSPLIHDAVAAEYLRVTSGAEVDSTIRFPAAPA